VLVGRAGAQRRGRRCFNRLELWRCSVSGRRRGGGWWSGRLAVWKCNIRARAELKGNSLPLPQNTTGGSKKIVRLQVYNRVKSRNQHCSAVREHKNEWIGYSQPSRNKICKIEPPTVSQGGRHVEHRLLISSHPISIWSYLISTKVRASSSPAPSWVGLTYERTNFGGQLMCKAERRYK